MSRAHKPSNAPIKTLTDRESEAEVQRQADALPENGQKYSICLPEENEGWLIAARPGHSHFAAYHGKLFHLRYGTTGEREGDSA